MGTWSKGRPVFKKVDGETRYLFVKDGNSGTYGAWYVMDSTTGDMGVGSKNKQFLRSGRGTNSPGSPFAGPSVRYGTSNWLYNDGGKPSPGNWKEVPGRTNYHDTGSLSKRYLGMKNMKRTWDSFCISCNVLFAI